MLKTNMGYSGAGIIFFTLTEILGAVPKSQLVKCIVMALALTMNNEDDQRRRWWSSDEDQEPQEGLEMECRA